MHDIREHWIAVSTLLGLISSVYRNLHHWRSNQRPQIAVLKLYNWATSSYCTQVMPNQLIMVIVRPINLNVSCKLHPYFFQRTRSSPHGHVFPRRLEIHIGNFYSLNCGNVLLLIATNYSFLINYLFNSLWALHLSVIVNQLVSIITLFIPYLRHCTKSKMCFVFFSIITNSSILENIVTNKFCHIKVSHLTYLLVKIK